MNKDVIVFIILNYSFTVFCMRLSIACFVTDGYP